MDLKKRVTYLFVAMATIGMLSSTAMAGTDLYIQGPKGAGESEAQLSVVEDAADVIFRYGIIENLEAAVGLSTAFDAADKPNLGLGLKYGIIDDLSFDLDIGLLAGGEFSESVAIDLEYHNFSLITETIGFAARLDLGDLLTFDAANIGVLLEPVIAINDMFVLYIDIGLSGFTTDLTVEVTPNIDIVLTDAIGLNVGAGYNPVVPSDGAALGWYFSAWYTI